jgi:hypothetical protein
MLELPSMRSALDLQSPLDGIFYEDEELDSQISDYFLLGVQELLCRWFGAGC